MSPYLALFKTRFIAGIQYRAAAWAGVSTQFFWGFIYLMMYRAFYRASSAIPPMTQQELVCYIWLQQSFLAIIMMWWQDDDLLEGIRDGLVAYELIRPYDLYSFWFARLMAQRLSRAALRCGPIMLIACFLPASYRMILPPDVLTSIFFLFSLTLALFLSTAVSMFIYLLTFITLTPAGAKLIIAVAADFFAGSLIPVPMFPGWLQQIVNFFPFRYMSDLPFRLYSGNITGVDALFQTGIQIAWIVGLILAGKFSFSRVMRRILIQGG